MIATTISMQLHLWIILLGNRRGIWECIQFIGCTYRHQSHWAALDSCFSPNHLNQLLVNHSIAISIIFWLVVAVRPTFVTVQLNASWYHRKMVTLFQRTFLYPCTAQQQHLWSFQSIFFHIRAPYRGRVHDDQRPNEVMWKKMMKNYAKHLRYTEVNQSNHIGGM